jgi:exodeoxyribonuclease VIII
MRQGSLVDCLITEPAEYSKRYLVAPQCDRRTKEGKAIWSEFQAEAEGREVITRDWEDNALRIVEALMRDPDAAPLLRDGQGQEPHFWHDSLMEADCRYKPDIEHPDRGILVDLKKARSASPRMFAAQSYSLAYDLQMAHYSAGWADRYGAPPEQCILIAYEWQWPHNISVNVLSADLIEEGHLRREEAITLVKRCMESDLWPSWGTVEMDVPRWAHADDPANATDADDLELEGLE